LQVLNAGTDTLLRVGTGPGAFDVTSSTNTVTGLLPGVTITALKADPSTQVSVDVTGDSNGMADKMAALVAAANAALAYIDKQSAYDADKKTGGPLLGDSMARDLRQQVTDAAIGSSSSTPALSGVSVGRDGTLSFDKAAFLTAYGKDPAAVAATMISMSQQLADVAKNASDPTRGSITTRITNEQDSIRDYTKQIADFEARMTLRQQTLQTQYAALETMLGKLQSQSQWLAGQLGSLPTTSSSK
jgi:flagellar hook-associated protein 2